MKELIINVDNDENRTIAVVENGILIEKYQESNNSNRIEGKVYIGKVVNILKGLQVAFVDIGEEKNAFLHIRDIIPKVSEESGNKNVLFEEHDINQYVKKGMKVLVQVQRDRTDTKGARVSTHINMPGRYCALIPDTHFVTVSQKVEDVEEKQRLKSIAEELNLDNYGIVIRTGAIKKKKDEIQKDILQVKEKIEKIKSDFNKYKNDYDNKLLYDNNGILGKLIMDILDRDLYQIITNSKNIYSYIQDFLKTCNKSDINIKLDPRADILDIYDIRTQLEKCKNRKIWLKCGGFITIDKTEALTAIDVNSGKYTGKDSLDESILTVNIEASIEIAKQLRLRDIGGIIVIDYIDMQKDILREKVLKTLEYELKKDRSKTQIIGFTKLDLVEMTRKHISSQVI